MTTSALKTLLSRAYQVLRHRNQGPEPVPPHHGIPADLKGITDMMHSLSADAVNLHRIYSPKISRNCITFIEILHDPVMTAVIIVIPPGQRLPLHDHPNMLGLIKVLHGQVRLSTYSKLGHALDGRQEAVRTQDLILSRLSYPQVLTPSTNNVHAIEFHSGEGGKEYAAFLDILSPPYNDHVGCHYYAWEDVDGQVLSRLPEKLSAGEERCTLVEIECPRDYRTVSIPYVHPSR